MCHEILFGKRFVAFYLVKGKGENGFVLGQLGQASFQFCLVGGLFDDKYDVAFFYIRPLNKHALFKKTFHPGTNVHGFDGNRSGHVVEVHWNSL